MTAPLFTGNGLLQIFIYLAVLLLLVKPLGGFMAAVLEGKFGKGSLFARLEGAIYRLCGIDGADEMDWREYTAAILIFSIGGFLLLYAILLCQSFLILNPAGMNNLRSDTAFNVAISFITNTNWQSYSGEQTLSIFSQMVGLATQNFISASVGLAVMAALARSLARRSSRNIGNFWVDVTRITFYILLPLSILWAVMLGWQGVPQTFEGHITKQSEQKIAIGTVASQVAIKQLASNGGGFFNANSAHPFENPTPLSNFLQMLAILLIPAASCYAFGVIIGDKRQGWAILAAMAIIFIPLLFFCVSAEQAGNPHATMLGINQTAQDMQPGGNMEGKEARFGIVNSAVWSAATTAASNGSVNSMLDSYTPIGGLVPMLLIQLGEVVFGGVGSGLYGMMIYVIISVFIAGLMIGRTPEYLGKKIEMFEMKMASLVILIPPALVLFGTALATLTEAGRAATLNPGAQGFSEILYAFSSAANNNGSAFAGLSADTPFYNILLGLCMLLGRFAVIAAVLAIAGSLAAKNTIPRSSGTLSTHKPLYIMFLVGTVLLVGALSYIPALALGAGSEYLNILKGGQ